MNVASCAPTRVWMFFSAQRPKAALPPAKLTSATMMPSRTRKRKMPALSAIAAMMPSLTIMSIVATGAKPQAKSAPITTPIKRDEYASFVISASVMAMMGGTSAQKVPTNCMMFLLSCATKHRAKKLSHDFHHDLTQKHQTTDVKHIKAPDRVDHDSTPSFRTTVRRVFPDDPSIDKTGILSTLRRRPLPHPTVSCRFVGGYSCQPRLYQDL